MLFEWTPNFLFEYRGTARISFCSSWFFAVEWWCCWWFICFTTTTTTIIFISLRGPFNFSEGQDVNMWVDLENEMKPCRYTLLSIDCWFLLCMRDVWNMPEILYFPMIMFLHEIYDILFVCMIRFTIYTEETLRQRFLSHCMIHIDTYVSKCWLHTKSLVFIFLIGRSTSYESCAYHYAY